MVKLETSCTVIFPPTVNVLCFVLITGIRLKDTTVTCKNLQKLILSVVLNKIGVEPPLAIGQAILGDVGRSLQSLDGFLNTSDLGEQDVILS